MKQRLYIDMDGVIAKWNKNKTMEEVFAPNYFLNLEPEKRLLRCLAELYKVDLFDLYILSAASGDHIRDCKKQWLKKFFPLITEDHIIFVNSGDNKSLYIGEKRYNDILLDDFSKNLHEWHGIGIKFMNGLNGTNGTWEGPVLKKTMFLEDMIRYFEKISMAETNYREFLVENDGSIKKMLFTDLIIDQFDSRQIIINYIILLERSYFYNTGYDLDIIELFAKSLMEYYNKDKPEVYRLFDNKIMFLNE